MKQLNLLAIDASTEACSAALLVQGEMYSRFALSPQSHSQLLLPQVDELLTEAGIKLGQLDGLVFGRGPGSFTGVRIGIGVAQGLGFAANLPMVGVSSLQAMAQQAFRLHQVDSVVAAIDARMAEIYTAQFKLSNGLMQAVTDETVIAPEQLKLTDELQNKTIGIVGTGFQTYGELALQLGSNIAYTEVLYPNAQDMLTLAIAELKAGNTVTAENAEPVYVRDTVSWKKLPGR